MVRRLGLALLILVVASPAWAGGTLSIPNIFAGKSTAPIGQFDANWDAIKTYVNNREITLDTLANRPTASVSGRLYVATDVNGGTLYLDTGSAWVQIAGATTGSTFLFNGTSAPTGPVQGNTFWLDPTANTLKVWDGARWRALAAGSVSFGCVTSPYVTGTYKSVTIANDNACGSILQQPVSLELLGQRNQLGNPPAGIVDFLNNFSGVNYLVARIKGGPSAGNTGILSFCTNPNSLGPNVTNLVERMQITDGGAVLIGFGGGANCSTSNGLYTDAGVGVGGLSLGGSLYGFNGVATNFQLIGLNTAINGPELQRNALFDVAISVSSAATTTFPEAITALKATQVGVRAEESTVAGNVITLYANSTTGPAVAGNTASDNTSTRNIAGGRILFGSGGLTLSTSPATLAGVARTWTDVLTIVPGGATVLSGTVTGTYTLGGTPTFNATATANYQVGGVALILSGTSASIGGGALAAGACTSGTVTVTGAATTMVADATPNTYPGDGAWWSAQVTLANTVTVRVCAAIALTPTASTYNVRVLQ